MKDAMTTFDLSVINKHLFIHPEGKDKPWLIDTGSPISMGPDPTLDFMGESFPVFRDIPMFCGRGKLSEYIGHPVHGLMGTDILNQFDIEFDAPRGRVEFWRNDIDIYKQDKEEGQWECEKMANIMGVPYIVTSVGHMAYVTVFDTGACWTFLPKSAFPVDREPDETITDFYPQGGTFDSKIWGTMVEIAGKPFMLKAGPLPPGLSALGMLKIDGIVGNEIIHQQPVVYSPRRGMLMV